MAIGTDTATEVFGSVDAVDDTTTSAINDGAMSVAADVTTWTNTEDATHATLILLWQYPSGTIDGNINIHIRPLNVDGTNDVPAPTATDQINLCGSFNLATAQSAATDTAYISTISLVPWQMKTSQEFEFYLFNDSGVQISANWDLDIVTKGYEA